MTQSPSVLIVEDAAALRLLYKGWLELAGCQVDIAGTGSDALAKLSTGVFDVALLDIQLPDISGLEILDHVVREGIPTTVVVLTADGSINTAVEAMRRGAYDFVVKPPSQDRLVTTIRNAKERQGLREIVETVREQTQGIRELGFIGRSPPMLGVYKTIEAVADSQVPVFVTGESGTGKEVCAHAIHQSGVRCSKPFISINCAAIPRDLMESELFGHVRGAFTGATRDRTGAVKSANGGTLFLDEICEMDLELQAKLLRFLQTEQIQAVGSDAIESVDVRIICATNRDPRREVAEKRFREDLYYRLHVVPLRLPPLRDRGADIVELADQFLQQFSEQERKSFHGFAADAEAALLAYSWPGNVRELQNLIKQIVVLHEGPIATLEMLTPSMSTPQIEAAFRGKPGFGALSAGSDCTIATTVYKGEHVGDAAAGRLVLDLSRSFAENERLLIQGTIEMCDGSIPSAAQILKLSPSTIYRKREGWKLDRLSK